MVGVTVSNGVRSVRVISHLQYSFQEPEEDMRLLVIGRAKWVWGVDKDTEVNVD